MKLALASVVIAAAGLTGCPAIDGLLLPRIEASVKSQTEEELKPYREHLEKVSGLADRQARKIDQLEEALAALKRDIEVQGWTIDTQRNDYKDAPARVGAESMGYSVARTDLGPALVKLAGISPYLDGYKVRLWISILTPIDVNGLKGTLIWVESDPAVLQKNKDKLRKREFATTVAFRPGRYSEVEIAVTPASAGGLKNFSVSLETDQLSISQPTGTKQ